MEFNQGGVRAVTQSPAVLDAVHTVRVAPDDEFGRSPGGGLAQRAEQVVGGPEVCVTLVAGVPGVGMDGPTAD